MSGNGPFGYRDLVGRGGYFKRRRRNLVYIPGTAHPDVLNGMEDTMALIEWGDEAGTTEGRVLHHRWYCLRRLAAHRKMWEYRCRSRSLGKTVGHVSSVVGKNSR